MKKLIFLMLLASVCAFGQTATNRVENTATIYGTNSPVRFNGFVGITNGSVSVITNNATIYQVSGNAGISFSVTNIGPALGISNVTVFGSGILTNRFTIP